MTTPPPSSNCLVAATFPACTFTMETRGIAASVASAKTDAATAVTAAATSVSTELGVGTAGGPSVPSKGFTGLGKAEVTMGVGSGGGACGETSEREAIFSSDSGKVDNI